MPLVANTTRRRLANGLRNLGPALKKTWENAQVRLSTMVLTDVPVVLMVTAIILTLFGVMMVLSASSVEQISSGVGAYTQARSQGVFALIGLVLMLVVGYLIPVTWYRRPAALTALLAVVVVLLVAVIVVGTTVNGNRNWINLGGLSVQPSEFAKPVMILWLASVYSRQGRIDVGTPGQTIYKGLMPSVVGFGLVTALILAGHDVGTVLVYAVVFLAMIMVARPSRALVMLTVGLGLVAGAAMVLMSPNRVERLLNTYSFWKDCVEATCDQANSGLAALATGGFWGVGLGQSRQKYNYLPEAHNDYIFAVVGEELGLIGALAVLVLYAALIYAAMRILLRSSDLFIRFATVGIITWIAGQALLNISMVAGVAPVIGVPLPFISAGGSALISSLIGVGILIAFARQTPLTSMVGESPAPANSKMHKDATRRLGLARIAEREQAVIAADPVGAGWTLDKFRTRLGLLIDGRARTPAPPASTPSPAKKGPVPPPPSAALRQSGTPHAAASQPKNQPEAPPPPTKKQQPVAPVQPSEPALPAGLRTIRKARQLPDNKQ
ncbi:FtsW/RodA/SpoVE family cell cycle protein [Rothia nasisuis]|uniref:FtsW/RodA/SpoVE family cell cycle protein n=2 Tax=Rothia nasisuis TaxID=2109647 RepID=UPI001F1FA93A|nr:putative peptidoglycan glycosyltransferase FtsW [Rothia nasisuis]